MVINWNRNTSLQKQIMDHSYGIPMQWHSGWWWNITVYDWPLQIGVPPFNSNDTDYWHWHCSASCDSMGLDLCFRTNCATSLRIWPTTECVRYKRGGNDRLFALLTNESWPAPIMSWHWEGNQQDVSAYVGRNNYHTQLNLNHSIRHLLLVIRGMYYM